MPTEREQLSQPAAGRLGGLLLLRLLIAGPMGWVAAYSLTYSLGGLGLLSDGWTLQHWQLAFASGGLRESLIFSPLIAATVTLVAAVASLAFVLIAPGSRNQSFTLSLLCLPLATPAAVMAIANYQILNPGVFLARLAHAPGLIDSPSQVPPLVNDPWAIGMLLTLACGATPLLTLFFLKTWTTARLDRACGLAESLGATRWQARRQVALPALLRRGRPLLLLVFLLNLGNYEIPLLLGRQSPQMFSVLTQRRFGQFDLRERPQAFALATTYFGLVSVGVAVLLAGRRRHA